MYYILIAAIMFYSDGQTVHAKYKNPFPTEQACEDAKPEAFAELSKMISANDTEYTGSYQVSMQCVTNDTLEGPPA